VRLWLGDGELEPCVPVPGLHDAVARRGRECDECGWWRAGGVVLG
jgi:hypothetical protein